MVSVNLRKKITNFFLCFTRYRILNVMRGYKKLQSDGQIHHIESLKDALSTTPFFIDAKLGNQISKKIPGFSYELAIRQFIMYHFGHRVSMSNPYIGLSKALLASIGEGNKRILYPIPMHWQNILKDHGFGVNRLGSQFLWILAVLFFWLYGVFYFFTIIWECLKIKKSFKKNDFSRSVFLKDLSIKDYLSYPNNPTNIISKVLNENSKDCLIWHDNKALKTHTSINNQFQYSFLPLEKLPQANQIFLFFLKSCWLIISSFCKLIFGKWQEAIMLRELILADFFSRVTKASLPNLFLFDHSKFVYRPIWTYITEAKGTKSVLYFYSTNNESVCLQSDWKRSNLKWSLMNWPNYWVWNKEQYDFIKRVTPFRGNIKIVGPILTGNNSQQSEINLPKKSVTVFDVQPQRDFKYQLLCEPTEYYIPDITNQFLDDIFCIVKRQNATMVYKGKRNIGKMAHYKYRSKMSKLSLEKEFLLIDSGNNAESVTAVSNCVISFPFTSTALIGKLQGKPSVYYDPTGRIDKLDTAAYGIPIISGPIELDKWLTEQLS
jgi:polysaccharide biosynthesis PFTS motif protein